MHAATQTPLYLVKVSGATVTKDNREGGQTAIFAGDSYPRFRRRNLIGDS